MHGPQCAHDVCMRECMCMRVCVCACLCARACTVHPVRACTPPARSWKGAWRSASSACVHVTGRGCVCYHACMQTCACRGPARPPHSHCMRHPSMATEKRGCNSGERERSGEGGRSQPAKVSVPPPSITSLRPLRSCSSVAAMVQPSTSWCGGTSRRPGRKPPSLHGRRLAPPALLSTRRLHEQPKQSLLPTHARARVAGGSEWGALKLSSKVG